MTWIKQDDKLHRNAKARESSDAAFKVWVMSWSYCADTKEPTGFLTTAEAQGFVRSLKKPVTIIPELVRHRMWDEVEGGFVVHEFEQGLPNTSTKRVREFRERKRKQAVSGNTHETLQKRSPRARAVPEPEPVPVPDNPSQSPSLPATRVRDVIQNGHHDDLGLLLATRLADLIQLAQPSAHDLNIASYFIDDFAYLSVDDMVEDGRQHVEHCKATARPLPRTIHGFRPTLLQANGKRFDEGAAKAWRPDPILGDLARLATPERDPDE